jgi:hypothetical protein
MKNTLLLLLLLLVSTSISAQNAYIQVNGEPGLSVFLNSQFKGKTTVEYSGYIIENVTPGKNTIKIVKEGYTPYEETITVKTGEVFAYKVKPFTKNAVYISEQGNSGQTDKKATIETGKLIVQSVPIEIKITMPDIEGVTNSPKTKDKWLADQISTGSYEITFTFGQKVITKTVAIEKDQVTSVFVNMLSGEFTVKTEEKLPYETREETIAYINKLLSTQRRTYYKSLWCSYCKDKVDNKLQKTADKSYGSYAFTYSRQTGTYSLTETTKTQTYQKTNGVHYETTLESNYEHKDISFAGEMVFVEDACDNNVLSGPCLTLLVKFRDNSSSPTYHSVIPIRLPDAGSIPQLKKAFLHLKELE